MIDARFSVVGIGNAIVDVLAHASDQFISENSLREGLDMLTMMQENMPA